MGSSKDHWADHARRWRYVQPPLRPAEEDRATVLEMLRAHGGSGPVRILLLGVTPELTTLPFPPGSELVAVEQNEAMITHVFEPGPQRSVVRAAWQALPFEEASFDLVLGDGCFTTLETKSDYGVVCQELHRVLTPTGLLLHRFFVRPDDTETAEQVFADLEAGTIGRLEVFKWRLAMSLVDVQTETVELAEIHRALTRHFGEDLRGLANCGYPPEAVATLDHYRNVPKRYTFPLETTLPRWLFPNFTLVEQKVPTYELGERCPLTLWRVNE